MAEPGRYGADPSLRADAGLARQRGRWAGDSERCDRLDPVPADQRPVRRRAVTDAWLPVALLIAVYGFFVGLFGLTPGMRLLRIRCVSVSPTAARSACPRALLRGVLLALLVPALIMDADRRGLHDRAAGSIVVRRRRLPDRL